MKVIKFIARLLMHLLFKIEIKGLENIPSTDGVIIAPNHISNWDPVIVIGFFKHPIKIMAKAELFKNFIFKAFFTFVGAFPINRGDADITAIKTAMRFLKNDEKLLVFPHGTRLKPEDDISVKEGVILIALKARKNIVPAYISGNYRLGSKIILSYGEPFDLSPYYTQKLTPDDVKALADELWSKMKELKEVTN